VLSKERLELRRERLDSTLGRLVEGLRLADEFAL